MSNPTDLLIALAADLQTMSDQGAIDIATWPNGQQAIETAQAIKPVLERYRVVTANLEAIGRADRLTADQAWDRLHVVKERAQLLSALHVLGVRP
jgi:hypothetical protein